MVRKPRIGFDSEERAQHDDVGGLCRQHRGNGHDSAHRFTGAAVRRRRRRVDHDAGAPHRRPVAGAGRAERWMRLGRFGADAGTPGRRLRRPDPTTTWPCLHGNLFARPGKGTRQTTSRAAGPNSTTCLRWCRNQLPPRGAEHLQRPAAIPREGVLRGLIAAGIGAVPSSSPGSSSGGGRWWWRSSPPGDDRRPTGDCAGPGQVHRRYRRPHRIRNLFPPIRPRMRAPCRPRDRLPATPPGSSTWRTGITIHHSSESDVCKTYSAFRNPPDSAATRSPGRLRGSRCWAIWARRDYGGSSDAAYIRSAGKARKSRPGARVRAFRHRKRRRGGVRHLSDREAVQLAGYLLRWPPGIPKPNGFRCSTARSGDP